MIYDLQKASFTKRASAFLLDFIFIVILALGLALLLFNITGYDSYIDAASDKENYYLEMYNISELEKKYEVSFSQYEIMSDYMLDDEIALLPDEVKEPFKLCHDAIENDEDIASYEAIMFSMVLTNVSLAILLAYIALEFIVPLLFKNGQTLGKKLFSIAVVREDCVQITPFMLFVRTILGKFTIETMVPLLMGLFLLLGFSPILPLSILALILLLEVVFFLTSRRTRSLIHDKLAVTVVVDLQSQMIFDSVKALEEYKRRIHKEMADKAPY